MATQSISLPSFRSCGVCGATNKTQRCRRCKVIFYCDREHQEEHYPTHKKACRGVANAESRVDEEEQELRAKPPDFWFPENVFETSVGHFWGIVGTRDYMRARLALFQALKEIETRDSVEKQLYHLKDLLRLGRSDNMGVRDMVPALMLRLGHDQDCFDFLRWYGTTAQSPDYDCRDLSLGFLDVKNADAFEGVEYLCMSPNVNHLIQVTLLKVKLVLDLKGLQNVTPAVGDKVPPEILDEIRSNVPLSPIIRENKEILYRKDHTEAIGELTEQVNFLYDAVAHENKHFWPALMKPVKWYGTPEMYSPGSEEEMQLAIINNGDAWIETPGAMLFIKDIYEKKGGSR